MPSFTVTLVVMLRSRLVQRAAETFMSDNAELLERLSDGPRYPLRLPLPPQGAYCSHPRMRLASCGSPLCGGKPCRVECPCGLSWMFGEGEFG